MKLRSRTALAAMVAIVLLAVAGHLSRLRDSSDPGDPAAAPDTGQVSQLHVEGPYADSTPVTAAAADHANANANGLPIGRAPDRVRPGTLPAAPSSPKARIAKTEAKAILRKFFGGRAQRVTPALFAPLAGAEHGEPVTFSFPGFDITGVVDSRRAAGENESYGVRLDSDLGRMVVTLQGGRNVLAHVFFTGESGVLTVSGNANDGGWTVALQDSSDVMCTPGGTPYVDVEPPEAADLIPGDSAATSNAPSIPVLNSHVGTEHLLYLDFDGEVVQHPWWNGGNQIVAVALGSASNPTFVRKVWERVAEDFAPFNVNVTTDRALFDATSASTRVHCIITSTSTAAPGSGGVSYVNVYSYDVPSWVFNSGEYACAETCSHEIGHAVGLRHDGISGGTSYYSGHGSGDVSWSPIMGAGFGSWPYKNVTQWNRGEYPNANNTEDDLAIITASRNGFGYRLDDKGNNLAAASSLGMSGDTITDDGFIERSSDQDWFRFTTAGGSIAVRVDPLDVNSSASSTTGANLAIDLRIYNAAGNQLAADNQAGRLYATLNRSLAAGTYYLRVTGAGRGGSVSGFTEYASLGQYLISGQITGGTPTAPEIGVSGAGTAIASGDGSPSTNDGTDFGDAAVTGGQIDRTFRVENSGDDSLALGSISENSPHFSVVGSVPGSLAPGASANFTLRFNPSTPGTHNAFVTIVNDDANESPYTFAVRGAGVASEDPYESNNTLANAYDFSGQEQVWLSDHSGAGRQWDDDWYRIDVSPGHTRVVVRASFVHSEGDVDIALHDANGDRVAFSSGTGDEEQIDFEVEETGTYFIRVYYGNRGNAYDLQWDDVRVSLWEGDEDLGGGWLRNAWLGVFYQSPDSDWIYHAGGLGWIHPFGDTQDWLVFYRASNGEHIGTGRNVFPYMWRYTDSSYVVYAGGPYFYNITQGRWEAR